MLHHLFNIDEPNRMADCEACGRRVDIYSDGRGGWRCALAMREQQAQHRAIPEVREALREYNARRNATPEIKAANRENHARYVATPKGKVIQQEANDRYFAQPEVMAANRERNARYHETPKGREVHRRAAQKRRGHICPELSRREKETLVGMQGGRCPICLIELDACAEWGDSSFAERDHAHPKDLNPREFRGYLDGPCNKGLDRFDRNTPKGARAAAYLELANTDYWHNEMLKVQSEMKEMEMV